MDSSRGFSDLLKQGASMMSSNSEGGNNHNNNNNNNNNNNYNNHNNHNNSGAGSKPDFLHSAAASLFSSSSSSSSSPPPPASHSPTATSHVDPANSHVSEGHPGNKPPPSTGELLSSAQVVFHAVKAKVGKKEDNRPSEEIPTGKVAGAAVNLLGAAAYYGKLDEAKYGKVIHKAEDYLHNYEAKHSAAGSQGYAQPGKHH